MPSRNDKAYLVAALPWEAKKVNEIDEQIAVLTEQRRSIARRVNCRYRKMNREQQRP